MKRICAVGVFLLGLAGLVPAQEARIDSEWWHRILIQGEPMGYGWQRVQREAVDGEYRIMMEQRMEFQIGCLGQEIAEIETPCCPDQIELHGQAVPYRFTLADLAAQILDEGDSEPTAFFVADRPAIRFEDPRGEGRGKTLVFILDAETLIGFELRWSCSDSLAALGSILAMTECDSPLQQELPGPGDR